MSALTHTIFRDLVKRDKDARDALRFTKATIEARPRPTKEEQADLDRITALLDLPPDTQLDPLFASVRHLFNEPPLSHMLTRNLKDHEGGVLKGQDALSDADVVRVAFMVGSLANTGAAPARLRVGSTNPPLAVVDQSDPHLADFTEAFHFAVGRVERSFDLARLVLPLLQKEGDSDGGGKRPGEVDTSEFAAVMDCLRSDGVTAKETNQLRRAVNHCLDRLQAVGVSTSVTDLAISVPNLNAVTKYQIQATNVEAMGPLICAAMFDELKAFEVVDKIVESAQNGTLTTGISDAGAMIYRYWKDTPNRMSDGERRNFYALTMGIPGGPVNSSANVDFNDLWIRFVSSVSSLVRQKTADQILRANIPSAVSQQQVRKAARDLAANLSLHGFGMVLYAARDLQDQISKIIDLLSHPDILRAYGAVDMWGVIDLVATLELGGARSSARYRTLATCGAIITRWLSQNIRRFNSTTTTERVIDIDLVLSANPPSEGDNATMKPTDYDLVNACELWLADTAVSDERIEQMSQPREAPAMTSRPVPIPAFGREVSDILEQALPPGLGMSVARRS